VRFGAALPATLFALAMTSAMAVGGVHVARRHAASAAGMSAAASLLPAAERAAIAAVAAWDTLARSQQPVGLTVELPRSADASVWVTRTAELEYLVVAEAESSSRPAQYHRIALTVVIREGAVRLPFPRAWSLLP
jgi:hypothetical protein